MRLLLQHFMHYGYPSPAALGPHVIRLKPASHTKAKVETYSLRIEQPCQLRWQQDPDGNHLARITFPAGSSQVESLRARAIEMQPVPSIRLNGQAVEMECWIRNGSEEPLTNMRAQVCIMFKGAPEFASQTNANKTLVKPRASVRSASGQRWIATEWEDCGRVWGNERCPCMHSDPKFPDCAPGETVRRKGRIWFGAGDVA